MLKLEEKYGNIHILIGLLVDEIKSLPMLRRSDFKGFECLSIQVNDFYRRLKLMGRIHDAENSYILKEVESKLNQEDLQKWLESQSDNVDLRNVEDLAVWLDKQTHIRRISFNNQVKSSAYPSYSNMNRMEVRKSMGSGSVVADAKCCSCNSTHSLEECPEFLKLSLNERWGRVKFQRCCFICLKNGHRRIECQEPSCQICSRPHHTVLNNFTTGRIESTMTASGMLDAGLTWCLYRSFFTCCPGHVVQ